MECRWEVLRTAAAWEALVPEWIALWRSRPEATPFQRPEWLLPWWRQFGQADLRVYVLRREGRLLAMLPLYVYPSERERQLLLVGAGTSDYLDGIFSPECAPEHLSGAFDLLDREGGWDRAYFTQLLSISPLFPALRGFRGELFDGEPCSRRPAAVIRALPAKLRAEVLYRRNAASALGKLRLEAADAETLEPMFAQLVTFHTRRWQDVGESGVLADERVLAHHREALPLLLASGLLRLLALRAGRHTLGVLYALAEPSERRERTQYFYLMGFNPELDRFRPGTLLCAFAMEQAAEEGFAVVDMLRGSETYKKFWHVESTPTYGFAQRPGFPESGRTESGPDWEPPVSISQ